MAKPVLAMEKDEVRAMLRRAADKPMNCALVTGKDPNVALLRLDLRKGPRILLGTLQLEFKGSKTPAYGTARVSLADGTMLLLDLNMVPSGTSRRVLRALKGSGITQVTITGEDGSSESGRQEEGEEAEDEADAVPPPPPEAEAASPSPAAAAAPSPSSPPPEAVAAPPSPPPPPGTAAAALTARLRGLIGGIRTVVAAAPARQAELKGLADAAQAALKANDLQAATTALDRLEAALGTPAAAGAATGAAPGAAPAAAGAVVLGKSRLAWAATRRRLETDLSALEAALAQEYAGDRLGPQILTAFRARVSPILATLDERLVDKLDEVMGAEEPARRAALIAEARTVIEAYSTFVAGDALLADLDDNPFVPLSIGKTVATTLAALSKALR